MKFSSTDKISETVSLIRNKKIYFIGRNKCIIKKNRVLACFQRRPKTQFRGHADCSGCSLRLTAMTVAFVRPVGAVFAAVAEPAPGNAGAVGAAEGLRRASLAAAVALVRAVGAMGLSVTHEMAADTLAR